MLIYTKAAHITKLTKLFHTTDTSMVSKSPWFIINNDPSVTSVTSPSGTEVCKKSSLSQNDYRFVAQADISPTRNKLGDKVRHAPNA